MGRYHAGSFRAVRDGHVRLHDRSEARGDRTGAPRGGRGTRSRESTLPLPRRAAFYVQRRAMHYCKGMIFCCKKIIK